MAVLPKIKSTVRSSLSQYKGLRREIYVLFFARIINSVGAFVHPLMTLILTDKVGLSSGEAGKFMSLLLLIQGPIMLLGGKLADKFGRLKLAVIFQFLGAAAYIVCGLLPASPALVYAIAVASCMYAISYPALDAMAVDLTQAGQRKQAFALLYMGFNLGFAIGPMLGGLMYKEHLQWLFLGDAVTTILATVLICIFVRETHPEKQEQSVGSEPELEQQMSGSVFRVLWQRKIILVFAFIMLIFQFVYAQWAFGLPLQMNDQFGENGASLYGWMASYNGLLVILFTPLIAILINRWRVMIGTAVGGLMYAAAFGMLIFIRPLPLYYVSMTILTIGEMVMTIDAQAFVADYSPSSHRGRLNSVVNSISGTGRMLSPMIVGAVITAASLQSAWVLVSAAGVVGGIVLIGATRTKSFRAHSTQVGAVAQSCDMPKTPEQSTPD